MIVANTCYSRVMKPSKVLSREGRSTSHHLDLLDQPTGTSGPEGCAIPCEGAPKSRQKNMSRQNMWVVGMAGRRSIDPIDAIWLNMDRPNNLIVIDSFMWFDEPLDWDRVTRVLRTRLVDRYPVFSQRPVGPSWPLGLPSWEDDPDFDLDRHLVRTRLPEPGDDAALQSYLEEQIPRPLDRNHPLWEYHLIDGYRSGCAIMARFHHALADGAALTEVLLSATDTTPDGDLHPAEPAQTQPEHPQPGRSTGKLPSLLGAALQTAETATSATRSALRLLSGLPSLASPRALVDTLTLAQQTGKITSKLLLTNNPDSPLTGIPGLAKRVVWSAPRQLDDVKAIGRLAGATVNDVLVSALAEALARYVASRGAHPVDLNTVVPVSLRKPGEPLPRELGNKFALVYLELPSGDHAPLERLALAKRRMDDIKRSPETAITFGMITAIGRTRPEIERVFVDFFSNKAFGVTTNVPGPRDLRYVAGVPMAGVLGWVPGSGHQSVGACIFTYNRTVRVGFKADAGIVPDPEKLVCAFEESIEGLLQIAGNHVTNKYL
jgi:diacylglycerol O-acyltransferase